MLNLAVLPVARRQGLGERLLRTALQEAEKTGINRALLEVRTGNAPAIALYEKCGFVRVLSCRYLYQIIGLLLFLR